MGNMCQEARETRIPKTRSKSHKNIMNTIEQYDESGQDMRQFLSLTSQNTPSCDFDQNQRKRNDRTVNDFKVMRVLGQGSFGKVMLVEDNMDGRHYAMKIIEKKSIKTKQQKMHTLAQRFILQAMDHPFVVKLHYAFQNSKKLYLFVDFMAGGQLFYLLRRSGKFQQQVARFYAAQLLLAMQYLHSRNIIYRDIKPQNILLDRQGHIKITDFGLSKICKNQTQVVFSICGTPQYIAPQVIMRQGYTKTADWFSFGSVLYDMLTGKPPFYSRNKNQILKNLCSRTIPIPEYLSEQAQSLLKALFTINPDKRLGHENGATDIKKHPFFQTIRFQQLLKRRVKSPFCFEQQINNRGFDTKLKQKVPLDSMQQQNKLGQFYDNFSYQRYSSPDKAVQQAIQNSKTFTLQYVLTQQ